MRVLLTVGDASLPLLLLLLFKLLDGEVSADHVYAALCAAKTAAGELDTGETVRLFEGGGADSSYRVDQIEERGVE